MNDKKLGPAGRVRRELLPADYFAEHIVIHRDRRAVCFEALGDIIHRDRRAVLEWAREYFREQLKGQVDEFTRRELKAVIRNLTGLEEKLP